MDGIQKRKEEIKKRKWNEKEGKSKKAEKTE